MPKRYSHSTSWINSIAHAINRAKKLMPVFTIKPGDSRTLECTSTISAIRIFVSAVDRVVETCVVFVTIRNIDSGYAGKMLLPERAFLRTQSNADAEKSMSRSSQSSVGSVILPAIGGREPHVASGHDETAQTRWARVCTMWKLRDLQVAKHTASERARARVRRHGNVQSVKLSRKRW